MITVYAVVNLTYSKFCISETALAHSTKTCSSYIIHIRSLNIAISSV